MSPIPAAGVLIGVLCALWTFVMGFTGWYKDPSHAGAFFMVIVIQVAGLIWGLRQTAAQGRTYSGQVVAGTLISIVAGVIMIGASLLFTNVAFPEYLDELRPLYRQTLQQQGKTDAEIASEVAAWSAQQTPMRQAMNGFLGTFMPGVVVSGIVGLWVRAKPAPRV
jgi:type VI protein secretion system component VasF